MYSRRAFLKLLGLSAAARCMTMTLCRWRGATFHALPRPNDQPNAPTVGIGYAPTPSSAGLPCAR